MKPKTLNVAIVGAGWAGMAAAVTAIQAGHTATVFEAARATGGRARALMVTMPDGTELTLDNGQHILIGAYTETLKLMRAVGVNPEQSLKRMPLTMRYPDGSGLALPPLPPPLNALAGVLLARGWSWNDKKSLLQAAQGWKAAGFTCPPHKTVARLSKRLTPKVMSSLIEPLCVAAMNTPATQASRQVFLTLLRDSLFGEKGASDLLLPTTDLAALFPQPAADWLDARRSSVLLGNRVERMTPVTEKDSEIVTGWRVNDRMFDTVLWATSPSHAATAMVEHAQAASESIASSMIRWAATVDALEYESIATVYACAPQPLAARLAQPMMALHSSPAYPAQFVFDRGQLNSKPTTQGLMAFVVSASTNDKAALEAQVLAQGKAQLGLDLTAVQTVIEKRATFACTPGLVRPQAHIAPSLFACGDYIDGPYPSTLEGAVRSGIAAARSLVI